MSYVIAIPTYRRYDILKNRTMKFLMENDIDKSLIHLFVANEEEQEAYSKHLDSNSYNRIIIGVKGLANQRQYITDYFPEGTHILSMDDDIESVDMSLTNMTFKDFITYAFSECEKEGLYLWGLYPVYNAFYREKQKTVMTTDLRFIVGAMYGYINRHSDDLIIERDEKEDVQRTILYYIKDGGVIRFNRIGFKTKYYGSVGGMGNFRSRLEPMKQSAIWLSEKYPDYGRIKVRKNGMWEFPLKRLQRVKRCT